jgi:hypothetical protein
VVISGLVMLAVPPFPSIISYVVGTGKDEAKLTVVWVQNKLLLGGLHLMDQARVEARWVMKGLTDLSAEELLQLLFLTLVLWSLIGARYRGFNSWPFKKKPRYSPRDKQDIEQRAKRRL